MLMKLTPGVNFISVLQVAFMSSDPKWAKKTDNLTVIFTLLGSAHTKAAHRTLMKLSPGHPKKMLLMSKVVKSNYLETAIKYKSMINHVVPSIFLIFINNKYTSLAN